MNQSNSFSFITDEVSQDLPDIARFARDLSISGIELRSFAGRAFKDLTDTDVTLVRSRAHAEGWRVVGCASPVFKCALDDAREIERHRDYFKRSLEVTRTLDCDLLRVFSFLREPVPDGTRWARMVDHVRGLLELARGWGVRVAVENEHSCFVATRAELVRLGGDITDPALGFVWDPCNLLYLAGAPETLTPDFTQFAPRIFHVHVKDAVRLRVGDESIAAAAPIGLGDVGWRRHFSEISRSGYRGWLSLETHWRVQALDESALHLPAGFEFSRGGEEASRVCLHNARALWSIAR